MGHSIKTFIGADPRKSTATIRKLVPDYMPMGHDGTGAMGSMEMPAPDNPLPMMTEWGQFGPIEMGGMFTVVKIRDGIAADDCTDPGWFEHPEGTVAYEWTGETAPVVTQAEERG